MAHTILLVEDNAQDEALTLRALRDVGLADQVHVARDGQQALDYLLGEGEFADRPAAAQPVVVLLDVSLPRVNGLDVLARVRASPRTRLLPVVMLTSSDEERDRLRGYERGANSFVHKPLGPAEFAETVARVATYWVEVNQPPPASATHG